jgi:hypothetical protein
VLLANRERLRLQGEVIAMLRRPEGATVDEVSFKVPVAPVSKLTLASDAAPPVRHLRGRGTIWQFRGRPSPKPT